MFPVTYSDNYVTFDFLKDPSAPKNAIKQKATCWSHEDEIRLIKPNRAGTMLNLNPQAITAVILGYNFYKPLNDKDKENKYAQWRQDLLDLLKDPKYSHVQVKHCELAADKYQLTISNTSTLR